MRSWLMVIGVFAVLISALMMFWLRPRKLQLSPIWPVIPVVDFTANGTVVVVPGRTLVADVKTFDDELLAYLMFGYFRGLVARDGRRAFLTYAREGKTLVYVIRVELKNDLLGAIPYLLRLRAISGIDQVSYRLVVPQVISQYESESHIFDTAYNIPARKRLELLPRSQLAAYVRRFIRFKAATDGRVRRRIDPIPHQPTRPEAHRLAEDIIAVADFYSLPLGFFLGIGAMENNYMNAQGDARNTAWKRRAEKGDVILKRGPKGVLVTNESSGIWQITKETLRYAHRLFLKDKRDYTKLPEHLRPPRDLNLNDVPPAVLTTYAGLFLRDLLDRFRGNVPLAVGAYNGGPGNPNLKYEEGVRMAAQHARTVLEHAAALQGRSATEMRFITSAR